MVDRALFLRGVALGGGYQLDSHEQSSQVFRFVQFVTSSQ